MKKTISIILLFFISSCSTQKNRTVNKAYHSLVSTNNVLFNGNEYLKKGILDFKSNYNENFWEILPIEPIELSNKIISVSGLENKDFLIAEEKAAKAIQKHSMLINEIQYNPKINDAYSLLGKARYFDQRYVPAIDAFNQINSSSESSQAESIVWKAKSNIRLNQDALAISQLRKLVENKNLESDVLAKANAALAMAYIKLDKKNESIKHLKVSRNHTNNKNLKARYSFILGQLYEDKNEEDSAKIHFERVVGFKRKIPRELYINAKIKTLQFSKNPSSNEDFLDLIKDKENEKFLDKIYYGYSQKLISQGSTEFTQEFLKKSIRVNPFDKILKAKVYTNISEINFNNSDYLLAGKYLDSALLVMENNSKEFWKYDRQRKGLEKVVNLTEKVIYWDSLLTISNYSKEKLEKVLTQAAIQNSSLGKNEVQKNKTTSKLKFKQTSFYFYNTKASSDGKKSFISMWGKRDQNTYWRSKEAVASLSGTKDLAVSNNPNNEKTKNYSAYLKNIPVTKLEKDSLIGIIQETNLELAEIYIVKYNNHSLGQALIKEILTKNIKPELLTKAKYLLYKSYKINNEPQHLKIKEDIIMNDSLSRYARILSKDPALLLDIESSNKLLDSLNKIFDSQNFKTVLNIIDSQLDLIESEEIQIQFEILKAKSLGRLEGVKSYISALIELENKYSVELNSIKPKSGLNSTKYFDDVDLSLKPYLDFKLVFSLPNSDFSENQITEYVSLIKQIINPKQRVSIDVYDQKRKLLVIHDYSERSLAAQDALKIKENIKEFQLKNNFVSLSSQYKNMLIYKTLD